MAGPPQVPQREPPGPRLSPLARLVLYIFACVATTLVVLVPTLLIVVFWGAVVSGEVASVEQLLGGEQLTESENGLITTVSVLIGYPALVLMTCLFVWVVDRRKVSDFGLPSSGLGRNGLLGTLLGVGFVAVICLTYAALGWGRFTATPFSMAWWVLATLLIYPLIGFTEEFVFRGYLMQTAEEWRGRVAAIVITSVLFWMVHLGGGNMHEPLGIVAMLSVGVIFALLRYGTGSLWLPISFHAAYDWAGISLFSDPEIGLPAFFEVEVTVPHWLVGPPGYVGVADVVFLLALLGGVYVFIYRRGGKSDLLEQAPASAELGVGVAQPPEISSRETSNPAKQT